MTSNFEIELSKKRAELAKLKPTSNDSENLQIMQGQSRLIEEIFGLETEFSIIAPALEAGKVVQSENLSKKDPRKTTISLPDGAEVTVGKKEGIVISTLIETGTSTSDILAQKLYDKSDKESRNKATAIRYWANFDLQNVGWGIINTTPDKNTALYSLIKIEKANPEEIASVEEESKELLSNQDAVYLATVINNEWPFVEWALKQRKFPEERIREYREKISEVPENYYEIVSKRPTAEEITKYRIDLIEKMGLIFDSGWEEELLQYAPEGIREVIEVFYYLDHEKIIELITSKNRTRRGRDPETGRPILIKDTGIPEPKAPPQVDRPTTGRTFTEASLGSALRVRKAASDLESQAPNPQKAEPKPRKLTEEEKAKLKREEDIKSLSELALKNHPSIFMTNADIARDIYKILDGVWEEFAEPRIIEENNPARREFLATAIAQKYIIPSFRQNKPMIGRQEITILRYLRNRHISLNPTQIEDLGNFVSDVVDFREGKVPHALPNSGTLVDLTSENKPKTEVEGIELLELGRAPKTPEEILDEKYKIQYPDAYRSDPEIRSHVLAILESTNEIYTDPISPGNMTRNFKGALTENFVKKVIERDLIKPIVRNSQSFYDRKAIVISRYFVTHNRSFNCTPRAEGQITDMINEIVSEWEQQNATRTRTSGNGKH